PTRRSTELPGRPVQYAEVSCYRLLRWGNAGPQNHRPPRAVHAQVEDLDEDREPHREVDIAPRNVLVAPFDHQHHADQQQEAECQHLDGRVLADEPADRPGEGHHEDDGDHDRGDHDPDLVDHADGRDDAVQGEHDVEQGDLDEDAGEG